MKGFDMLIPQSARSESRKGHGSPGVNLAELRRLLASPSEMNEGHRQRLLDLARSWARVQALGDGYARVELSEHVQAAMKQVPAMA
jgi:hypothetical protein